MLNIIENECLKIVRRRRFLLVVGILLAIVTIVAYSQHRQLAKRKNENWRVETVQRISRYQNMIRSGRISPAWERSLRAELGRLQYHVDRDIQPDRPTAPVFTRTFANAAGFLLLPLLIAILASDIVSAETAEGTDKLLLTRPVRRWKILFGKGAALAIFTTLTLATGAVLAYAASSVVLESRGWDAPVFTGFRMTGEQMDFDSVRQLPLWLDTILAYGLEWFALLVVAAISLFLSVVFRSSSASIGTMLACLIGGTILTRVSPDWSAGRYLFVTALPLADYYSGQAPPYEGMSLIFCISLLAVWAIAATVAAFLIFTRRDVFG